MYWTQQNIHSVGACAQTLDCQTTSGKENIKIKILAMHALVNLENACTVLPPCLLRFRMPAHVHGIASQIRCAVHPALPFLNYASKHICLRLLWFSA
jgi:hypothetical protein